MVHHLTDGGCTGCYFLAIMSRVCIDACTGLLWAWVSFRGQICSHRQDGSTEGHSEVLFGSNVFHLPARADESAGCNASNAGNCALKSTLTTTASYGPTVPLLPGKTLCALFSV